MTEKVSLVTLRTKFIEELAPFEKSPFFCIGEFSHIFKNDKSAIKFWTFCGLHFPYILNPVGPHRRIQFQASHAPLIQQQLQETEAKELGTFLSERTLKKSKRKHPSEASNPEGIDADDLMETMSALKSELARMATDRQQQMTALAEMTAKLGSMEITLTKSIHTCACQREGEPPK